MNTVLDRWNSLEREQAAAEVLPCNGSGAWARAMAMQRPFAEVAMLFAAADTAWASLPLQDQQEAFDSHPRLGERHAAAATERSLQWSKGEQSQLGDEDTIKQKLTEANRLYEQRFGRIFLLCASGKSATEILAVLRVRMVNDEATELREAAEQQRRITQLRLRKWLGLAPCRCEDV